MSISTKTWHDVDLDRLREAYASARGDLLDERDAAGHWVGELSTSALATATAVSAMSVVVANASDSGGYDVARLRELIDGGVGWLSKQQNDDGGYGDTTLSYSNIATTMLVVAAIHLVGKADSRVDLLRRANEYIDAKGRLQGLRDRYGKDKTFAVPILTNCAIAGLVEWKDVAPLPFEAACLPQSWYRFVRLPVVSYAVPALVGIGQAKYFHDPPRNPIMKAVRRTAVSRSLNVLQRMQPGSGGYLEAVPLTSFVTMSLASTGRADHTVARNGIRFIVDSVRPDGSWPIDTNLATWNTTLALNALAGAGEDIAALEPSPLDWLLSCQYHERHPFTGADPGGFGWSDLSGAVPDADDTPGAILSLAHWCNAPSCTDDDRARATDGIEAASRWLADLQNSDGGWPTFCRGWSEQPFDRSGSDLTAHALRAFVQQSSVRDTSQSLLIQACSGLAYLKTTQRSEGSWLPLWFGNQDDPNEENAPYGTTKVLLACEAVALWLKGVGNENYGLTRLRSSIETIDVERGYEFLKQQQNDDGGWGGGRSCRVPECISSVEETALAIEALLAKVDDDAFQPAICKGLNWLINRVENNEHRTESPIGFYFAKLWYHERLYPLTFTVAALGKAAKYFDV